MEDINDINSVQFSNSLSKPTTKVSINPNAARIDNVESSVNDIKVELHSLVASLRPLLLTHLNNQ